MNVVAPAARDTERFVKVNDEEIAPLYFDNSMEPQDVTVKYNYEVQNLTVTEVNLMLKILVVVE